MPTALSHRPKCLFHAHVMAPRRCFCDWVLLFLPVLIQALRLLTCGSLLTGTGPLHTHLACQKKRARRKHSCFLKAVAHVPMPRTRPLATAGAKGEGSIVSVWSVCTMRVEQGFRWSTGHFCPPSSKYERWFTDSGHTFSRMMKAADYFPH